MKAIMIMFDSLNRHFLPPYGCDWTHAPNFARLAERALTFDQSYVGSMPCMPARRELHTARPNFLHSPWAPLQPFDDSVPAILSQSGVTTHLASDHYHYWEDGGSTYHGRYDSWQFARGQEGDPCIGQVADPDIPPHINGKNRRQDWVNRQFIRDEADYPQPQTFAAGLDFIERNKSADNWFLQIECFDPHEPFVSPEKYRDLFPDDYDGPIFDWPGYRAVRESPAEVEHLRRQYAALLAMCDASLGRVLDAMDADDLWEDTLLMVWTDHGFLLGEHDCWAKNWPPLYQEVAHTPFFIHDPRHPAGGERRQSLVQPALDLGPTLLDFFGVEKRSDMLGHALTAVIAADEPVREAAIFGYFGQAVNVTDGRHVYLRQPTTADRGPLFQYTLLPVRVHGLIDVETLQQAELAPPFGFSKGCPLLKLPAKPRPPESDRHLLFDIENDPQQQTPLDDARVEAEMIAHMKRLMTEAQAPPEQFVRMGLE